MLIHAQGVNRGDVPIKVYHIHDASGCVLIGDAVTRILLTPEEIPQLYKLLEPFVKSHPQTPRSSTA
jgi:hypothetical protein